jgi:hypothetical protein
MKPNNAELEMLAGRLRLSVEEARYGDSQLALAEYAGALRKVAAGLSPGDPGLRQLEEECLSLLEQSRRQVLVGRAHAGARLARLERDARLSQSYGDGPSLRSNWQWSA